MLELRAAVVEAARESRRYNGDALGRISKVAAIHDAVEALERAEKGETND
jgi:hypothetical protein